MKDKTDGCSIVSCASLVLNISLPAMIDGKLYSGNTPLLPYSTKAAIRNGEISRLPHWHNPTACFCLNE